MLLQGIRASAEQLQPATAEELDALGRAQLVTMLLHFDDGSTSCRPSTAVTAAVPGPSRIVGCSLQLGAERAVHWDLRSDDTAPAWAALTRLLVGGTAASLLVPNAQVVMRTALLARPQLGSARAFSTSRWIDPCVLGWLATPDAKEDELLLPALYRHRSSTPTAKAAAAASGVVDASVELAACYDLCREMVPDLEKRVGPAAAAVSQRELRVAQVRAHSTRVATSLPCGIPTTILIWQVLADMEVLGLPLHPPTLARPSDQLDDRLRQLTDEATALLGRAERLNLSSPQQARANRNDPPRV